MNKLDKQTINFIHDTVHGYLNGCYDDEYSPMTMDDWKQYVWQTIEYEKDLIVNGEERKHLHFAGKEKFYRLTEEFLKTCDEAQPYII